MISLVMMFWISFGGIFMAGKYKFHLKSLLPLRVDQCPSDGGNATATAANVLLNGFDEFDRLLWNDTLMTFETNVTNISVSVFENSSTLLLNTTSSAANATVPASTYVSSLSS